METGRANLELGKTSVSFASLLDEAGPVAEVFSNLAGAHCDALENQDEIGRAFWDEILGGVCNRQKISINFARKFQPTETYVSLEKN